MAFRDFEDKLDLSQDLIKFSDGPNPPRNLLTVRDGGGAGKARENPLMPPPSGTTYLTGGGGTKSAPAPCQLPTTTTTTTAEEKKKGDAGAMLEPGTKIKVYNKERRGWRVAHVMHSISSAGVYRIQYVAGGEDDLDTRIGRWQVANSEGGGGDGCIANGNGAIAIKQEEEGKKEEEEEEIAEQQPKAHPVILSTPDLVQMKTTLSRDDAVERARQLIRALKQVFPLSLKIFGQGSGGNSSKSKAELDEALRHLVRGTAPPLVYNESHWWASIPTLLRWGQGVVEGGGVGAKGGGTKTSGGGGKGSPKDAGLAVKVSDTAVEVDKKMLRGLGLYVDSWPVPFEEHSVRKANQAAAAAAKVKGKKEEASAVPVMAGPKGKPGGKKAGSGEGGSGSSNPTTKAKASLQQQQLRPTPPLSTGTKALSAEDIQRLVAPPPAPSQELLPATAFPRPPPSTLPPLVLPHNLHPWDKEIMSTAVGQVLAIAKAHPDRWVSPKRIITLAQQTFSKRGLKDIGLAQAAMAYLGGKVMDGWAVHRVSVPQQEGEEKNNSVNKDGGMYYYTEEVAAYDGTATMPVPTSPPPPPPLPSAPPPPTASQKQKATVAKSAAGVKKPKTATTTIQAQSQSTVKKGQKGEGSKRAQPSKKQPALATTIKLKVPSGTPTPVLPPPLPPLHHHHHHHHLESTLPPFRSVRARPAASGVLTKWSPPSNSAPQACMMFK